MDDGVETRIIQKFARDIATKLNAAAVIARAASELGTQGLPDRAFQTLLDTESLIRDAATLLNAASVVRRDSFACGDPLA